MNTRQSKVFGAVIAAAVNGVGHNQLEGGIEDALARVIEAIAVKLYSQAGGLRPADAPPPLL